MKHDYYAIAGRETNSLPEVFGTIANTIRNEQGIIRPDDPVDGIGWLDPGRLVEAGLGLAAPSFPEILLLPPFWYPAKQRPNGEWEWLGVNSRSGSLCAQWSIKHIDGYPRTATTKKLWRDAGIESSQILPVVGRDWYEVPNRGVAVHLEKEGAVQLLCSMSPLFGRRLATAYVNGTVRVPHVAYGALVSNSSQYVPYAELRKEALEPLGVA